MKRQTFYYSDELHDDFGATVQKIHPLPPNYRYVRKNIFFRLLAFVLYRLVARPLVWVYMKVWHHHKFVGKKVLRDLGKSGCFLYANHTMLAGDAFIPNLFSVKKRNYILTGRETNSLTAILPLLNAFGNIPLRQTGTQRLRMMRCVKARVQEGATVTIYPEAHVWPYYTGVRPFGDESFRYPVICNAPVICLTTCYQKRRFGKRPRAVTYVDGPFYPREGLSHAENMQYLRNAAYDAMRATAAAHSTYAFHDYRKAEERDAAEKSAPPVEEKAAMPAKKRFTIFGVEFIYLCLFGILVAFGGWVIENLARLFGTPGTVDCRFHLLPFISPYGLVVFGLHIALGDPDALAPFGFRLFRKKTALTVVLSNVLSFVVMSLFVFLGELAVGNAWEHFFGVKLWDYTGWPLNVTQYTSIFTTLGLGLAGYLLFRLFYKPVLKLLRDKVNYTVAKWIVCTLGVAIVLDTTWMILHLAIFHEAPMYWSVKLRNFN